MLAVPIKWYHAIPGSYRSTSLMWKTTYLPSVGSRIRKQCPTHKPTMIGLIYTVQAPQARRTTSYLCSCKAYLSRRTSFFPDVGNPWLLSNFHKPAQILPKKTSIFIMGCPPTGNECRYTHFFLVTWHFVIKPVHCLISESGCKEGGAQNIINHYCTYHHSWLLCHSFDN